MLFDPLLGLRVGPLDVRLEVVAADAVVAAAADLGRAEFAAADEGVALGQADVELLGDLLAGEEAGSNALRLGGVDGGGRRYGVTPEAAPYEAATSRRR